MDSRHEKNIKIHLDSYLEAILLASNEFKKKEAAKNLLKFSVGQLGISSNFIAEYIFLFAQSKGSGVTNSDLVSLISTFDLCKSDVDLSANEKSFLTFLNTGFTRISKKQFGKLTLDNPKKDEKMNESSVNDILTSNFKNAKTELTNSLKSYRDKLGLTEGKRKKVIQQALQSEERISDSDFLIHFMVAYRVFEKYPTSKQRKAILRGLFGENHPFRPFIDLFSNEKVKFQVSGVTYSSLEAIFKQFYEKVFKNEAKQRLNEAIVDQLIGGLIQKNMTSSGEVIKKHSILEVLVGLIGVGAIEFNGEQVKISSAMPLFEKMIEKFAIVYQAEMLCGRRPDTEMGFRQYFQEIIERCNAKIDSSKELVVNKGALRNCLEKILDISQKITYESYFNSSGTAHQYTQQPITNTGTTTTTTTTNVGIMINQMPLMPIRGSMADEKIDFALTFDPNESEDEKETIENALKFNISEADLDPNSSVVSKGPITSSATTTTVTTNNPSTTSNQTPLTANKNPISNAGMGHVQTNISNVYTTSFSSYKKSLFSSPKDETKEKIKDQGSDLEKNPDPNQPPKPTNNS